MEFSPAINSDFIDAQYRLWKRDPDLVTREWGIFFEGFELGVSPGRETEGFCDLNQVLKQARVQELIHRYRDLGHLLTCVDPLSPCPTEHPLLELSAVGLSDADLDLAFYSEDPGRTERRPLREILRDLQETYCRSIGVEYMHLQDPDERRWLQERMEPMKNRPAPDDETRIRILNKLCQATLFEQFLHVKYVGQKRFSLEGGEVLVALLDGLFRHAADAGCREIVMGMAHRGRLNVQVNVLQKLYETVFCEFEDSFDPHSLTGSGDVKYHKGYLAEGIAAERGPLRVFLADNPSHLEAVNPVVEGIARARQEGSGTEGTILTLPLLIHGDAAFSGQGVVSETLNLSRLEGYHTGGTIHIVLNNQIGYTTLPKDARSTRYSTDVAKMLMVPIFHVHGEDPEAAVHVAGLACDYRREFAKDVVIDLVCYRRHGHNEGDEPYYTQPEMYERIKDRPPPYELYAQKLLLQGTVNEEEVQRIRSGIDQCMAKAHASAVERACIEPRVSYFEEWEDYLADPDSAAEPVKTEVPTERLLALARRMNSLPAGFSVHRKLARILDRRLESVEKGGNIDWATAELLAFASLLEEGTPVRLSGQDSRRGTFSQRHSVLIDPSTGNRFIPLNALADGQARYSVYDSMLSENAVLGFEYGYSLAAPQTLTIWEAQFGDFANNAQVIIDQFISSSRAKWGRPCGVVLFLPHGVEGQGPEHSSARIERYLQLCAEDNMRVCNPTTPAQHFHLLRGQVMRDFRRPLVVLTPKGLLRHPGAVSTLGDLTRGAFQEVLDDFEEFAGAGRMLVCSGRIYYELQEQRTRLGDADTSILRLEQFYPFPADRLRHLVNAHGRAARWTWVQEEPRNMGAWEFVKSRLAGLIDGELHYVGRPAAASPAVGHLRVYREEQKALIERAFTEPQTT